MTLRPPQNFGYIRASTSLQVLSPDMQRSQIEAYAARHALIVHGWYIDPATSGKANFADRAAGKQLASRLRRGDSVIVTKLDRLTRSFLNFALLIDGWEKMGVTLHIINMGVYDPTNVMSKLLIRTLVNFAEYEREMISIRTKEAMAERKAQGGRMNKDFEWGWTTRKVWNPRTKKHDYIKTPNDLERAISKKVVELVGLGYTNRQVCDYLNDEWKVQRRVRSPKDKKNGHDSYWPPSRIPKLFEYGLNFLREEGLLREGEPVVDFDPEPEPEEDDNP